MWLINQQLRSKVSDQRERERKNKNNKKLKNKRKSKTKKKTRTEQKQKKKRLPRDEKTYLGFVFPIQIQRR